MALRLKWRLCRAADGQFYWRTEAANGEILATSETYTRRESAEKGAEAAGCPAGELVDDSHES